MHWDSQDAGVMTLPSGRLVRGRRLRSGVVMPPEWGLYLTLRRPEVWSPSRWVCWPDFGLPVRSAEAVDAVRETWARCAVERVEIACGGGVGRTGTALAALAVLDGLDSTDAIRWVRDTYHPHAVETPWQRAWLRRHLGR